MSEKVYIAPMPEGLKPCVWTEDAIKLVKERYLRRDQNGQIVETIEGMCWRVAYFIASYDRSEEEAIALAKDFYGLMADRKFFPNAPTMYNAGTGNGLQFSACFVLPVGDSMEEIYDAIKWQALVHKSGGGTGFSFSSLRQKGAIVGSTRSQASGPLSFLEVFDASTDKVIQGGTRRGANMAMISVHHPDISLFLASKGTLRDKNKLIYERIKPHIYSRQALEDLRILLLGNQISHFNISVAATDAFMKAVKEDTDYDLTDPRDNKVVSHLKAKKVFNLIVKMAWETGDPGLWFADKVNKWRANPIPNLMTIRATNPCGEQPLFDFDVCNLGSINLSKFLTKEGDKYKIDYPELERAIRLGVHFLDNVIDLNPYPLPQIMDLAHKIRRIGLGVMGWADMLAYLNIPYASNEACRMAEEVMKFINNIGHGESEKLAEERGAFPLWDKSIYKDGKPIRNCTVTTIAPTGELSILAGCSGGIEPHYGLTKTHHYEDRVLRIFSPAFQRFIEVAKLQGFYSQALEEEVKNRGRIGDLDGVPDDIKKVFTTAHEIIAEWHVRMQAAFQKNTDNGVSKTINLPNSATLVDVEKAFWLAYETECLGITVFRDGCKGGVLSVGIGEKSETRAYRDFIRLRPNVLGTTIKVDTPDGAAFVTINWDSDVGPKEPFEIFVTVAKAGTDAAANAEANGRLASEILREESSLSPIEKLLRIRSQLSYIGGPRIAGFGRNKVLSVPDGIGKAIDIYLKRFELVEMDKKTIDLDPADDEPKEIASIRGNYCPRCHNSTLYKEEGCTKCTKCPYNEC